MQFADQDKDITAHHVSFHDRSPGELELLPLSDLSHYGVCSPLESLTVMAWNWEVLAFGSETIWWMALIH